MLSTFITSFSLKVVSYENVKRNYKFWKDLAKLKETDVSNFDIKCIDGAYVATINNTLSYGTGAKGWLPKM
jgi:hypothetical protein